MTYIKTQETLVKSLPQQERWMANYDGESWTISFEKLKMSTAHHAGAGDKLGDRASSEAEKHNERTEHNIRL